MTQLLQAQGHSLVLVARHEEKLKALSHTETRYIVASVEEVERVSAALEGVEVLLTMVASDHQAPDFLASQQGQINAQLEILKRTGICQVVNLSSVGAHVPHGNGVLRGLYHMEQALNALEGVDVVHVRPSFYLENAYYSLGTIASMGIISLPTEPDYAFPMIATRDVAQVLAELLGNFGIRGKEIRPLLGVANYSLRQFAQALGTAIGQPNLPFVPSSPDEMKGALLAHGAGSEDFIDQYIELSVAMGQGLLNTEIRDTHSTTPTTLEAFAQEVFAPAYQAWLAQVGIPA